MKSSVHAMEDECFLHGESQSRVNTDGEFPQEVLFEVLHGSRCHGSAEAEALRSSSHTQPKIEKSEHGRSRPEVQEDVGVDLSE